MPQGSQPHFPFQVKDQESPPNGPSIPIPGQRLAWGHMAGQGLGGPISTSQVGFFSTEPVALLGSHGPLPGLIDITMALWLK